MMGNRKDCKWWRLNEDWLRRRWRSCDAVDITSVRTDVPPDDGAWVYAFVPDDYGLEVDFRPGPMFGCALFEARDAG